MEEVFAGEIIREAGEKGGILGMLIFGVIAFMAWYIYSSRKYHAEKEAREAQERNVREKMAAEERKEWRETLERNTAAFHGIEKALQTAPCFRPSTARTRVTDSTSQSML